MTDPFVSISFQIEAKVRCNQFEKYNNGEFTVSYSLKIHELPNWHSRDLQQKKHHQCAVELLQFRANEGPRGSVLFTANSIRKFYCLLRKLVACACHSDVSLSNLQVTQRTLLAIVILDHVAQVIVRILFLFVISSFYCNASKYCLINLSRYYVRL